MSDEDKRPRLPPAAQDMLRELEEANERLEKRAGRNLPVAILVGLALGAVVLASLFFLNFFFALLAGVAVAMAAVELAKSQRAAGIFLPRVGSAVLIGLIPVAAYFTGAEWLLPVVFVALVALWGWYGVERMLGGGSWGGSVVRDLGEAAFTLGYLGVLASFAVILAIQPNGELWTLGFIAVTVANDTGAYATGVLFGKHPMAPRISPHKTWEGMAGALGWSLVTGVLISVLLLGQSWVFGLVFGLAICVAATVGDLAESVLKRDIGTKDMGSVIPGHGGVLDRIDSMLFAAPVAYGCFVFLAAFGG